MDVQPVPGPVAALTITRRTLWTLGCPHPINGPGRLILAPYVLAARPPARDRPRAARTRAGWPGPAAPLRAPAARSAARRSATRRRRGRAAARCQAAR